MAMIQRVMASNSFQEFNNLLDATVDVAEGESLGRGDYLVMKVMRRGVFVARETGPTFLLPADAIPMPTPAPDSPPEAVAPASGGTPTPTGTGG
jgi:hypothetical protein